MYLAIDPRIGYVPLMRALTGALAGCGCTLEQDHRGHLQIVPDGPPCWAADLIAPAQRERHGNGTVVKFPRHQRQRMQRPLAAPEVQS